MDGEHKVSLVIYSGLPDPVWTVQPHHEKFQELRMHLDRARSGRQNYRHQHLPCHLGFKGFLVHHREAEHEELIVGHETKDLQRTLLDTMPDGLIPATLRQKIVQAIESGVVSADVPTSTDGTSQGPSPAFPAPSKEGKTATDEKIQHYAPELNLPRWNNHELIRRNNNCYNYGNDTITNSFAQPGQASGCPIGPVTPDNTLKSAMSDGLLKMDVPPDAPCPEAPEQPNCLVALAVAEGVDYHWYRLDNNGLWSHKPGGTAATNVDGKGELISDPRKAANSPWGPDYEFVSFMQIYTNIMDGPLSP